MDKHLNRQGTEVLKNWRAALPSFEVKNQQIWHEYLDNCMDAHKREVARYAANFAKYLDTHPNFPRAVGFAHADSLHAGTTTSESVRDAMELLVKVSKWGDLIKTRFTDDWEHNEPLQGFDNVGQS
ncbi:MAG: hypothetical protein Q7S01_02250 [bacterium]|nr:hypothetical protein [bacterium]